MPINNLPGVGPTNADIATAVAAPSAATIASTVAASVPTLAQINTAVNTQTNNSAIATAVAGAVPTLSQINTSVANNAPSPNAWTFLGSATPAYSANNFTLSGLSGWRTIRILLPLTLISGSGSSLFLRINNDSTNNMYQYGGFAVNSTSLNMTGASNNWFQINGGSGTGQWNITDILIENATSSSSKRISAWGQSSLSNTPWFNDFRGQYQGTSGVSSITIWNGGAGTIATTGPCVVYGAN